MYGRRPHAPRGAAGGRADRRQALRGGDRGHARPRQLSRLRARNGRSGAGSGPAPPLRAGPGLRPLRAEAMLSGARHGTLPGCRSQCALAAACAAGRRCRGRPGRSCGAGAGDMGSRLHDSLFPGHSCRSFSCPPAPPDLSTARPGRR